MNETTAPTPLDLLRTLSPEGAKTFLDHRAAILDNPELQAIPEKYKLLIGIGVAAALQCETCTLTWTKQARGAGATEEEIVEALLVSRHMKMATVNVTAGPALAWLNEKKK
jgi:AhpD family alkylhydroperoxidase